MVERFATLFDGHRSVYGVYNDIRDRTEEGKLVGRDRRTARGAVTLDLWKAHLEGRSGLGICPINLKSESKFGAVDIDVYDGIDHAKVAKTCQHFKFPIVVCRSKSGGAHLYLFCKEWVPARLMVDRLRDIAAALGHGKAEVFPKQKQLASEDDGGNWINMPYFGVDTTRYAITDEGRKLTAEEFLDYAESRAVDASWFSQAPKSTASAELPQGPPCLQQLVKIGFEPGTRNNGLYNLGVYARKSSADNWKDVVEEQNQTYLSPPLEDDEVKTIIKSLAKKAYNYSCHAQPIVAYCNSSLCRTRKFGISQNNALPEFGQLRKLASDPPVWYWEVDGQPITLATEELQDSTRFQRACMNSLTLMPPVIKRDAWGAMVSEAMRSADVIPAPLDSGPRGQFWQLLRTFCHGPLQAQSQDELLMGKPWTSGPETWFSILAIKDFLQRRKFNIPDNVMIDVLREHGGDYREVELKGVKAGFWVVSAFPRAQEPDVPESINDDKVGF